MDSTPAAVAESLLIADPPTARLGERTIARTIPMIAIVAAVSGLACFLFVDVPLARYFHDHRLPNFLHEFLDAAEHFGTFYGQILILLVLFALDPENRRPLVRIAACAWSAGLAANIVKLFVFRTRPKSFDFDHVSSARGFLGVFEFASFGSRNQSFPSAHTATAIGFCVALSHVFPKGRWAFLLMAVLVGLQRIDSMSHFASDVVAGGLLGWLVGIQFSNGSRLSRAFDQFDAGRP